MSQPAISPEVRTFIAEQIEKADDLHVLLLLTDSPDRWWDAESAARELHLRRGAAREALDRLTRRNLLDIRITGDLRYQFHPGTEDLRKAAIALYDAYRANPLLIMTCVTGSARRSIRDFADAFRIRPDDDDR
jgi:hypothetical protein